MLVKPSVTALSLFPKFDIASSISLDGVIFSVSDVSLTVSVSLSSWPTLAVAATSPENSAVKENTVIKQSN